jgi:hypothetical protein
MYLINSILNKDQPDRQIVEMRKSLACYEPFQFTRFSDGELFMLLSKEIKLTPFGAWIDGKQVNSQRYDEHDCKTFIPSEDSLITTELLAALQYSGSNYIKGLPLPCCVGEELFDQLKSLSADQLGDKNSTANLLINANYPYFIEKVLPVLAQRPIIFVANKRACLDQFTNSMYHIKLGDDCKHDINHYESLLYQFIMQLSSRTKERVIILFAASYLSNILIYRLASRFPEITMIDVGTALHPLIKLGHIRHYLQLYWSNQKHYSYHQCQL